MRIFARIRSVFFTLFNKLRFGRKLQMNGIQGLRSDTEIVIKNGQIRMDKDVAVYQRVSLTAVAGGILSIGQRTSFNRNCIIICREKIQIGENCMFGPNVLIYDHDHVFNAQGYQPGFRKGEVVIGKGCWIGAGVTILRDTPIGDGCVIGAGAVVKGEIPSYSLVTADRKVNVVPLRNQ